MSIVPKIPRSLGSATRPSRPKLFSEWSGNTVLGMCLGTTYARVAAAKGGPNGFEPRVLGRTESRVTFHYPQTTNENEAIKHNMLPTPATVTVGAVEERASPSGCASDTCTSRSCRNGNSASERCVYFENIKTLLGDRFDARKHNTLSRQRGRGHSDGTLRAIIGPSATSGGERPLAAYYDRHNAESEKGTRVAYSPVQIASHVFSHLQCVANKELRLSRLGTEAEVRVDEHENWDTPRDIVLTVPAAWSDEQRNAVREAAALAGLKVKRVINDSTAIAMALRYFTENANNSAENRDDVFLPRSGNPWVTAVCHVGGGSVSIDIVEEDCGVYEARAALCETVYEHLDSLSTNMTGVDQCGVEGATKQLRFVSFGGKGLDDLVVDHIIEKLQRNSASAGSTIVSVNDSTFIRQLYLAVRDARHALSTVTETQLNLKKAVLVPPEENVNCTAGSEGQRVEQGGFSGDANLVLTLTRTELEGIAAPMVRQIVSLCLKCADNASKAFEEEQRAYQQFHRERGRMDDTPCASPRLQINRVVVSGGLSNMPMIFDAVRKAFGPYTASEEHPASEDNRARCIPPFASVADPSSELPVLGAALMGRVLTRNLTDVLLIDVARLSLGVEVHGSLSHTVVPRNTIIPIEKRDVFTTTEDGQTIAVIRVFRGERLLSAGNELVGECLLEGIPPLPKGVANIDVAFIINPDGLCTVKAKAQGAADAQGEASLSFVADNNFTKSECDAVFANAYEHWDEDLKLATAITSSRDPPLLLC